jgi:hypothetical protein
MIIDYKKKNFQKEMKLTMIFPSLEELNGYLEAIQHNGLTKDHNNLSLTGEFQERDLELAERVFQAVIIEAK